MKLGTTDAGDPFTVPLEIAKYSQALLAVTGSGKSNAAVVLGEEMYEAGIPWVAIDPKGDWYGIHYSSTKGKPGLPIPVFGGLYGNSPLRPEMGARMAELVVELNMTCVLDVSDFDSKNEMLRFVNDFVKTLFRLHAKHRSVRHVFLEECDEYMPQKPVGDEKGKSMAVWCLATCQKLVKQGRGRGLGCTMISQRPAVVNKDALTQIQTLFVLGMTSPQDRKAVREWVDYHVGSKEIVDSLPMLEPGEAWVLSPRILKMIERITFRRRWTLDTGSTPEFGETAATVGTMATIDMTAIEAALADVIEQAEATDPSRLQAKIRELEKAVTTPKPAASEPVTKIVEVEVVPPSVFALAERLKGGLRTLEEMAKANQQVEATMTNVLEALEALKTKSPARRGASPSRSAVGRMGHSGGLTTTRRPPEAPAEDTGLSSYATWLLVALAKRHPIPMTTRQWSVAADRSTTSSAWDPAVRQLRKAGLIGQNGVDWFVTDAGLDVAGVDAGTPPPSGAELVDWWCNRITGNGAGAARTALRVLADKDAITQDELADLAGWSRTSSGPGGAVGTLVKLGLVERRDGLIYIDDTLR